MEEYKFTIAILIVCLFAASLVIIPVGYIEQNDIMLAVGAILGLVIVLACILLIALINKQAAR